MKHGNLIMRKIIFIIINLIVGMIVVNSISCCKRPIEEEKPKTLVNQFIGDTLVVPKIPEVLYRDSLFINGEAINKNQKLFIITFLWGDCNSCISDLKKWDSYFHFINNKKDIDILFYLYTSDLKFFKKSLYSKEIHKFPLILDHKNSFIIKNNLPHNKKMYQTFLLDSNNKVILVGNPIYSEKLMELYKEEINKRLD